MTTHWDKVSSSTFESKNETPVVLYRSKHSQLTVAFAKIRGPLVKVSFCVRINPEDDFGAGHALEHLVFKGSTCFEEQNILDRLCNTCYSSSTNAATYPDHTKFEFSTICTKSLPNLLSVFLCHIFNPSLRKEDFKSEIYFRGEDCRETGVMFCELKEAYDQHDAVSQEVFKRLYPDWSPFTKVAGGSCKNTRKLNLEMVKKFHDKNYRPENTCIIISGEVSEEYVLSSLSEIDLKLFHAVERCDLNTSTNESFPWPNSNEVSHVRLDGFRTPVVAIGWRCHQRIPDIVDRMAVSILTELVSNAFDTGKRSMSNNFTFVDASDSSVAYVFDDVSSDDFDQCESIVKEKLKDLAHFQLVISLEELHSRIADLQLSHLKSVERDPHSLITQIIIQNFLIDQEKNKSERLESRLNPQEVFSQLLKKDSLYWRNFLNEWIENPWVIVKFDPAKKGLKTDQVSRPSTEVIYETKKSSKAFDATSYLDDLSENVKLLLEDVHFLEVQNLVQPSKIILEKSGLRVKFYQTDSAMFNMTILSDTKLLTERERLLLPLFSRLASDVSIIFGPPDSPPIFVPTHASIGLMKSEPDSHAPGSNYLVVWRQSVSYLEVVNNLDNWLDDLLVRRLSRPDDSLRSQMEYIRTMKKKPKVLLHDLQSQSVFKKTSNQVLSSLKSQETFFQTLESEMSDSKLSSELQDICDKLFVLDNLEIFVTGDFHSFDHVAIAKPWKCVVKRLKSALKAGKQQKSKNFSPREYQLDKFSVEDNLNDHRISGSSRCETSSLMRTTFLDVIRQDSKTISAIMVAAKILAACEGENWSKIRGQGLAYHFGFQYRASDSLLCLSIQDSINIAKAFAEISKNTISILADNDFFHRNFESARRELLHELVDREDSVANLAFQVVSCRVQNLGEKFNRELIGRTFAMVWDDLIPILPHFNRLFKNNTVTSIVCPVESLQEVIGNFKKQGIHLQTDEETTKNLGRSSGQPRAAFI